MKKTILLGACLAMLSLTPSVAAGGMDEKTLVKNAQVFCGFTSGEPTAEQKKCIDAQVASMVNVIAVQKAGASQDMLDLCMAMSMAERKDADGKTAYVFDIVKMEKCLKS